MKKVGFGAKTTIRPVRLGNRERYAVDALIKAVRAEVNRRFGVNESQVIRACIRFAAEDPDEFAFYCTRDNFAPLKWEDKGNAS